MYKDMGKNGRNMALIHTRTKYIVNIELLLDIVSPA